MFIIHFRVVLCLMNIFVFFSVDITEAAVIEPKIDSKEVKKNEFVFVPIYLDTQFEEINAVEVYVNFSDNLVFRDYLDGKSIITHWIEKPHFQYSDVRRPHIVFYGMVAGGISGKNLNLVDVVFESKENGKAKIEIDENSKILLNDGLGTKTKLIVLSQNFNILEIVGTHLIKIKALDKAGNFMEKSEIVNISKEPEVFIERDYTLYFLILFILILLLIIILFFYLLNHKVEIIHKEIKKEKLNQIQISFRQHIKEILMDLKRNISLVDKDPKLSQKEKEVYKEVRNILEEAEKKIDEKLKELE